MRLITSLVCALSLTALASAQGKPDPQELAKRFTAEFNSRDAARVSALFADDAIIMPPDVPMVKGRAAILEYYKTTFSRPARTLSIDTIDADVQGQRATIIGTIRLQGGSPSGGATAGGGALTGKYIVVYKQAGADWRIAYQIFNYDTQVPAAP